MASPWYRMVMTRGRSRMWYIRLPARNIVAVKIKSFVVVSYHIILSTWHRLIGHCSPLVVKDRDTVACHLLRLVSTFHAERIIGVAYSDICKCSSNSCKCSSNIICKFSILELGFSARFGKVFEVKGATFVSGGSFICQKVMNLPEKILCSMMSPKTVSDRLRISVQCEIAYHHLTTLYSLESKLAVS